jgi:electron transfer flavoprotein beta subunit
MTGVLVCVKRVVDSSGEVVLTDDGQSVDGRFAGFTVSNHEECAVELAVQVAAATEGTASVLTLGDADAVEQLRSALAVGCTAATHIEADSSLLGPADVAREIAAVVRDRGVYDLVLLGNDAADSGDFQVGIRLAYELGWPVVNGAAKVSIEDANGVQSVVASVAGPDGHETYRVPLPAVVTVLEGGVEPRYPTVPGRMKAKKVEIEQRTPCAEPAGPKRVRLSLPPPQPSDVQILGKGAEAAPAVVDLFERLGVLSR